MDLTKITDIGHLKALAYDRIATTENAQAELQAIQTRIKQLLQEQAQTAAGIAGTKTP